MYVKVGVTLDIQIHVTENIFGSVLQVLHTWKFLLKGRLCNRGYVIRSGLVQHTEWPNDICFQKRLQSLKWTFQSFAYLQPHNKINILYIINNKHVSHIIPVQCYFYYWSPLGKTPPLWRAESWVWRKTWEGYRPAECCTSHYCSHSAEKQTEEKIMNRLCLKPDKKENTLSSATGNRMCDVRWRANYF